MFSHGVTFFSLILQRVEPERTLTDSQRDEFEDMLRALTLERSQIKDAMGFALDNADAAGEVNADNRVTCQFLIQLYRYYQRSINQWGVSKEKKRKKERPVLRVHISQTVLCCR